VGLELHPRLFASKGGAMKSYSLEESCPVPSPSLEYEELARSNAELLAFAHTVAHDLKEPLRTISAFSQILVRRAKLDEADQEIADFIVEGARRMTILLDHLLATATRDPSEQVRSVNLEDAAAQAMQNLSAAMETSEARVTVEPLPAVQGNECDLVRLFQNLIANALKYRREVPVEVRITAERFGPDWVIRVRDNGIGIPKDQYQFIFGIFSRLHAEAIPGTGIGLATCKKIVARLGGAIWVDSSLGVGSTFSFTVPAGQDRLLLPPSLSRVRKPPQPIR
jgi:light-regulated signal transduction histidine kinase (bacteriophytochrome)